MRCDTKTLWLALLGFMATVAWGSEDSQTNGETRETAYNRSNKKIARKQYLSSNSWGRRVGPGAVRVKPGRHYDEDEDEDDGGYYGESSYGSYGESSYGGSYAPSYGASYAPQIQIPQVQAYQPTYYYQQQQQQPSIVPIYVQSGGYNGYKKKKKKRPICCCDTDKCLEACDTATNTECACDMRCCARYNATGCPVTMRAALATNIVYLRQFDNLSDKEEYDEEEVPDN